jgi:hypothetical protein
VAAFDPTDVAAVKLELGMPNIPNNDQKLVALVAATNAYVRRYRTDPIDPVTLQPVAWDDAARLGAARLAAGLYRNANSPGITDSGLGGAASDTAFRRVTDVLIEQLLRIGRHAPPSVG